MPAQQQKYTAAQINAFARSAIRARGVRMLQQIYSQTVNTGQTTVTVNPRNVGLILGFWVKVTGTVTNNGATAILLTDFGPANVLSQIQLNDLSNNTRIQTMGWHLNFINSWKQRRAFSSALVGITGKVSGLQIAGTGPATLTYQGQDSPTNYGANWSTISAPPSIAGSAGTGVVTMWYYVPLAYNPDNPNTPDLRGAIYANVVNATMQLFLSLPGVFGTSLVAAFGADSTLSVYQQSTNTSVSATFTNVTISVYQDYIDQLPIGNNGVLLPILDLATIYELKYTNASAISSGQDFPYQYANFREFLSTIAVYVNTASTGARAVGTDINYWALQSANFTNIWKVEPALPSIFTRQHMGLDYPPGTYMFDSRGRPISTTQYGNMQLVLNASTAGIGAYELIAVEDFALVQTLSMAGSLAAS